MTQPLTVNVEQEELLARAAEVEQPILGLPAEIQALKPPCTHPRIIAAAEQLVMSANNIRTYVDVGEGERQRLAESLRNAAKAYDEVDEGAAEAIENGTSVSTVALKLADQPVDPATLTDTPLVGDPPPAAFRAFKQRAYDLEQPDQGAAFLDFADAWETYRVSLLKATDRFRPFKQWEGEATLVVEESFDQQRQWLIEMAGLCGQLAAQARTVVDAHRWVREEHITIPEANPASPTGDYIIDYAEALRCEETWERIWNDPNEASYREFYIQFFQDVQQKSDLIIREYEQRANLPLAPVSPSKPPAAARIEPPQPEPEIEDDEAVDPIIPSGDLPSDDEEPPAATGLPSSGSGGLPETPPTPSELTDALADLEDPGMPDLPTDGLPGLSPASVGAAGKPPMPLKEPFFHEASPAAAANGAAGLGRGMPGAAGAMGGGGMGAAPLGGQGDKGAGKAKRVEQEEDAIYTEERPWTEGVIGLAQMVDKA